LFFSCLEECCHKSKDVAKLDIQSIFWFLLKNFINRNVLSQVAI
jgi:hypothetical protein